MFRGLGVLLRVFRGLGVLGGLGLRGFFVEHLSPSASRVPGALGV